MPTDIEIAEAATPAPIADIGAKLGLPPEALVPYGHDKAKVSLDFLSDHPERTGKLVLVSAISPTPPGEGKTTVTVGLVDGLNSVGSKAVACLREPSMGPVFGMKGGAAGGGYAQLIPMVDISLHFTGDLAALAAANNLLSALIDNHIHHANELGIDPRTITWKRAIDLNDRALRHVITGLGGPTHGVPREDGFDITAASELMAVLCLAWSLADLRERIGRIVIGYNHDKQPVTARDLRADGALTIVLKDALAPNLVQTLEGFARPIGWAKTRTGG